VALPTWRREHNFAGQQFPARVVYRLLQGIGEEEDHTSTTYVGDVCDVGERCATVLHPELMQVDPR